MTTPNPPQSLITAISGVNTAETILEQVFIGSNVQAGDSYVIEGFGTCTTSQGNLSTFAVRIGTAGTIADPTAGTMTCTSSTTGVNVGFYFRMLVTFRSVGAYGTVIVNGMIQSPSISSVVNTMVSVSQNAIATTVATNVANFLEVTYKSAGITTSSTFQNVTISKVK